MTLGEIEKAVDTLTTDETRELHRYIEKKLEGSALARDLKRPHSVLDIPPVQLGGALVALIDGDVLDEMLENRITKGNLTQSRKAAKE